MIGSWRWNFILGLIALVFTFSVSLAHNVLFTSLIGSIYSFLIAFIFGYIFRWALGTLVGLKGIFDEEGSAINLNDEHVGNLFDQSTPSEDESLNQLLKENMGTTVDGSLEFSPLQPPKLVSKVSNNPEELAKVLRHLSEK